MLTAAAALAGPLSTVFVQAGSARHEVSSWHPVDDRRDERTTPLAHEPTVALPQPVISDPAPVSPGAEVGVESGAGALKSAAPTSMAVAESPTPLAPEPESPTPMEPAAPGESVAPGIYEEYADNQPFVAWPGDTEGSATTITGGAERLHFLVYVRCDAAGACTVEVELTNTSGSSIQLAPHEMVEAEILSCDGTGDALHASLESPETHVLAAQETTSLAGSLTLAEPGQYCVTARTTIEILG